MNGITLLDVAYLLEAFARGVPNEALNKEDLAAANRLQDAGLMVVDKANNLLVATERGAVFCEAIRAVPLPVQCWVMPKVAT